MVGVYTHCTYTDQTYRGLGGLCLYPLYLHGSYMWRFGWSVFTPTVLTLIKHVEVWMVGVYTHCTYTDHTCRGLDGRCLHPLYLH